MLLFCTVSDTEPSKGPISLYLATPLGFNPRRRLSPGTISVKFLYKGHGWPKGTQWRRNIAENFNHLSIGHMHVTDDRQTTDGRMMTYSERERGVHVR